MTKPLWLRLLPPCLTVSGGVVTLIAIGLEQKRSPVSYVFLVLGVGFVVAGILFMADVLRAHRAALALVYRLPLPRPIDQEGYAAILQADDARCQLFRIMPDGRGAVCLRCSRTARLVDVRHPIWDGPFDEAGSGVVDRRLLWWCKGCDGLAPPVAGAPVRLPYLDHLPIRLLRELYDRTAFHELPGAVELYEPPPPAPASAGAEEEPT